MLVLEKDRFDDLARDLPEKGSEAAGCFVFSAPGVRLDLQLNQFYQLRVLRPCSRSTHTSVLEPKRQGNPTKKNGTSF